MLLLLLIAEFLLKVEDADMLKLVVGVPKLVSSFVCRNVVFVLCLRGLLGVIPVDPGIYYSVVICGVWWSFAVPVSEFFGSTGPCRVQ